MGLRQAANTDAERKAADVRIRAERRSGELLKEMERAQTSGLKVGPLSNDATTEKSEYAATLERNRISRQTASRYQALVNERWR